MRDNGQKTGSDEWRHQIRLLKTWLPSSLRGDFSNTIDRCQSGNNSLKALTKSMLSSMELLKSVWWGIKKKYYMCPINVDI